MRKEDSHEDAPALNLDARAIPAADAMPSFPVADDELERLRSLYSTGYLEAPPDPRFGAFTRLAARMYDAPMSAISLIAGERALTLSAVGVPQGMSTPREDSFCARCSLRPGGVMIVEDASRHPDFESNPLVTGPFGFRFYAGVALKDTEGRALGVLCVIDTKPRSMSEQDLGPLQDLAIGISAIIQRDQMLSYGANHELVTGLPNRQALRFYLSQKLDQYRIGGSCPVLAHIDIDEFNKLRDSSDHRDIDVLLRQFADRLSLAFPGADMLAHFGADEFAALLPVTESVDTLSLLLKHAVETLHEPYLVNGTSVVLEVTIGLAIASFRQLSVDGLLRNANIARCSVEFNSREKWRIYSPSIDTRVAIESSLPQLNLKNALRFGELSLAYQPIVIVPERRITSLEVLLRWNHPQLGPIPPAEFIPLAERNGMIVPIGMWALREACREATGWSSDVKVSVNISPLQITSDLPEHVSEILADSGLQPERLILEVTETTLLEPSEGNVEILKKLRNLGVQIALDDFGTGFSSLNYLLRFSFDEIKIDRTFVSGVLGRHESQTIVHAVIDIGRSLGIPVVAEGVETAEQLAWLIDNGCDQVQGYFWGGRCRVRPSLVSWAAAP
ncbi:putative bifunctional diguanylate cyclase/phosphodiesterase [Cupriavidus sp. D39]|uniref:putative bifunctional diguanylate cyclase/phosphodiesterase n=1 Tax=Cupriavidus sp. D39 TaxID=2997877 RepID=UPI00227191B1|nr:GGDEF domain-containing protein [Cupriavidus sp. D39]MCY0854935.1 GGDEF domain-containing protein [Cupriavidus sp. D39]